MTKIMHAVSTSAILALLAGCGSQPPLPQYVAPAGAATANLKSEISGADSRNESIHVYVSEGPCGDASRKELFSVRASKSDPGGYRKMAANRPLRLEYMELASGGRTCHIDIDVNLEGGHDYSLVGGFDYKPGPIPIITGTRMCRLGVRNDADGTVVSRKSTCSR